MNEIRVLLVDDHAILREGLRALLSYYPDIQVVGEARDGEEGVALAGELQPEVVLMDIAMPGMGGLEATRSIHERLPRIRVLILTQHEDRQYVLPLLQAGASGYVLKRAPGTELVDAIRTVARGGTYLHPTVATVVVDEMRGQTDGGTPRPGVLTSREREILGYIVEGKTSPQIAEALVLSVKTVEWHRTNLMSKLGLHNTAELVRYALQHGLVDRQF